MSLERFTSAQDSAFGSYRSALAELRSGRKTGHWIWYIFPQLAGLGSSSMSRTYALRDLDEAAAYLRHPVLRDRLAEVTNAVAEQLQSGVALTTLMGGSLDAQKLVSSLTLFEIAAGRLEPAAQPDALAAVIRHVLAVAERQGFGRCGFTQRQLGIARDHAP